MHAQFYLLYAMSRSYCIIFMYWSLVSGCRLLLLSCDCAHPSSHHFQIASSLGELLEVEPCSLLAPVVDFTFCGVVDTLADYVFTSTVYFLLLV